MPFVDDPAAAARFWGDTLETADGRRICRVRDPFGTVWGLNGPA